MNDKSYLNQITFNLLLFIVIIVLISVLIIFVKNIDLIKLDSIVYGMKIHNYSSCSCQDVNGNFIDIPPKDNIPKLLIPNITK